MPWFESSRGRLLAAALVFLFILVTYGVYHAVVTKTPSPGIAAIQSEAALADAPVPSSATSAEIQTVAIIGNLKISTQDMIYRQGIAAAYGTDLEAASALVALINDALVAEVAITVGVAPSLKALESFAEHAGNNSKAPILLAAIEALFGDDKAAFQRIYLAPKIINRTLRYWFSRDEHTHQQQRASMQQAWSLVQSGQGFEQVAKATGLHFATQDYGKKKAVTPDALKAYFPTGMASMSAGFKTLLQATKPGAIMASIAEDDHSYRIVRLISREGDIYRTEEISLTKASFDDWYQRQIEQINVEIIDAPLKESIQSRYNNIAWVQRLTLPFIR